jgi:DNA-binding NarL/FixJ family response regulator
MDWDISRIRDSFLVHRIVLDEFNQTDMAVLQLMDMGYKCSEIAHRLNIVTRSVYRIRRKLCVNLDVRTPEQIVAEARRRGLLPIVATFRK